MAFNLHKKIKISSFQVYFIFHSLHWNSFSMRSRTSFSRDPHKFWVLKPRGIKIWFAQIPEDKYQAYFSLNHFWTLFIFKIHLKPCHLNQFTKWKISFLYTKLWPNSFESKFSTASEIILTLFMRFSNWVFEAFDDKLLNAEIRR